MKLWESLVLQVLGIFCIPVINFSPIHSKYNKLTVYQIDS